MKENWTVYENKIQPHHTLIIVENLENSNSIINWHGTTDIVFKKTDIGIWRIKQLN